MRHCVPFFILAALLACPALALATAPGDRVTYVTGATDRSGTLLAQTPTLDLVARAPPAGLVIGPGNVFENHVFENLSQGVCEGAWYPSNPAAAPQLRLAAVRGRRRHHGHRQLLPRRLDRDRRWVAVAASDGTDIGINSAVQAVTRKLNPLRG